MMVFEPELKGTLEQKLELIKNIHSRIIKTKNRIENDNEIYTKLSEKRIELEKDIDMHLLNKERIKDPLLDYCFRQFSGHSSDSSVFDMVPKINKFLSYIEKNKGEKILVVHGDYQETGIISGQGQFTIEKTFRYLHIPVEKLLVLNQETGNWSQGKIKSVYINPDIFQHPSDESREGMWVTNHSGLLYVGGHPKETFIYAGNSRVEEGLEKHPIPARKQKIDSIHY